MKRIGTIAKRLLHPGAALTMLFTVICALALFGVFINGWEMTPVAFAVYGLSVYTLAVLLLQSPGAVTAVKTRLYANRHIRRLLMDIPFRVRVSLYGSLTANLAYALFKLAAGILYSSVWFGAVAVYYIVLSGMRFFMLCHLRGRAPDAHREYRQCRFCGCLLFALNLALIGFFYQLIHGGKSYHYPGYLIYVIAAYTFLCFITSIVGLVRFRKRHSPSISLAKAIGLSAAFVSLFTLQSAMFASFGGGAQFQLWMNYATGSVVCLLIFGMAVGVVVRSHRKLKELETAA